MATESWVPQFCSSRQDILGEEEGPEGHTPGTGLGPSPKSHTWCLVSVDQKVFFHQTHPGTSPGTQPKLGQDATSFSPYTPFLSQSVKSPHTHRHSLPRVLLSSALWRCGYWSASLRRAACAHTMKAFMGRFTWGLALSVPPPPPRTGIGTRLQS